MSLRLLNKYMKASVAFIPAVHDDYVRPITYEDHVAELIRDQDGHLMVMALTAQMHMAYMYKKKMRQSSIQLR